MDEAVLRFIVEHRTPQFMLANWDVRDWLLIAGDAIILLLACRHAPPRLRQLLLAALSMAIQPGGYFCDINLANK